MPLCAQKGAAVPLLCDCCLHKHPNSIFIPLQANNLNTSIPSYVPGATSDLIAAFTCSESSPNPFDCGHGARQLIDQHLPRCEAMLLQNLPLSNPEACAVFVDGLGYSHMSFEPPGAGRAKASSQLGALSRDFQHGHNEHARVHVHACSL